MAAINRAVIEVEKALWLALAHLRQGRGVKHPICQLHAQKPAIGDIDLDLAHQLALGADAKQVADEQRLEHQGWVKRWPAIVGAIEPLDPIVNEGKIDHRIDLAKQVILRNQTIERHHLERGLFRAGLLQHAPVNQKPLAYARGLSAV